MSQYDSNGVFNVRRQIELPSPQELKDFIGTDQRNPSVISKQRDRSSVGESGNETRSTTHCCSRSSKARAYKNLFGVSISLMIVFSVYLGVASLQSSINESGGIGLASLTTINFLFIVSTFYTSAIVRLFGTKYTLIVCFIGKSLYTVGNYYPSWYTLVPTAVCVGIILGPFWVSLNVHVTSVAIQYASASGQNQSHVVALFLGIYTGIFKLAYIPANIISSVILLNEREENTSIIDTSQGDVCNNTEAANLNQLNLYILLSVYVLFDILAIVLLISFVDHLGTESKFLSHTRMFELYVKKPFVATLKVMLNWKLILIFPMSILDAFVISFSLGNFTKLYISDCIGVHWIGFSIAVYGLGSTLMGVTVGRLVKCIQMYFVVYPFFAVNLGIVVFLLLWDREPSYFISLLTIFGWGACDGTWSTTSSCLVGTLLSHKQEEAYSILRMSNGVGFFIGFGSALFFNTKIQLCVALGLISVTFIGFSILTIATHRSHLCCFRNVNNK